MGVLHREKDGAPSPGISSLGHPAHPARAQHQQQLERCVGQPWGLVLGSRTWSFFLWSQPSSAEGDPGHGAPPIWADDRLSGHSRMGDSFSSVPCMSVTCTGLAWPCREEITLPFPPPPPYLVRPELWISQTSLGKRHGAPPLVRYRALETNTRRWALPIHARAGWEAWSSIPTPLPKCKLNVRSVRYQFYLHSLEKPAKTELITP